jgi:cytosine/adenosine deaminase-related metal-dependent hydrolase
MRPVTHTLIKGGAILSMDPAVGDFPIGDVLIENDRIAAVGPSLEAPPEAEVIDAAGMIIAPGFVNSHMHTWQAGIRGLAADWTIPQYLRAVHAGLATHFRPDDIEIANYAGALTQLSAGTTTLVDWCHNNPTPDHTDAAIDGLERSGIRALFLHGSPKPDPKEGQRHFSEVPMPRAEVERLARGRLSDRSARVTLGLAILGPGLAIYDVCDADHRLARDHGLNASMHISGGPMKSPDGFERLLAEGFLDERVNIVHGNSLSDEILRRLVEAGVTFSVTAEVELQMGFGWPLTGRLRALGSRIAVGSDVETALSSDMFTVTRMTLQAQRHQDALAALKANGAPPSEITITCRDALAWATIDGAHMAGMADRVGSLTPGKQADVILVDTRDIGLWATRDLAATMVLHAGPRDVDTVIVAGEVKKRGKRLLAGGLDDVRARLEVSGRRILHDFSAARAAHG